MAKTKKQNIASELIEFANKDISFDGQPKPLKRSRRSIHHYALGLLTLLLIFVAAWALAINYFAKFSLGQDVISTHQSDAALRSIVQAKAQAYRLNITYPDGTRKSFSLQDMGMNVNVPATVDDIRQNQRQVASRLQWWHPVPAEITVEATKQTNAFIAQHATVTVQPAQDATITLDNGKVKVSNSTLGKHYGLIGPITTLTSDVSTLQTQPLHLQTLATRAAITANQLASSQSKIQKILSQNVSFIVDGKTIQANSGDISNWIELTPQPKTKSVDVTVNSGKVLDYINNIAADAVHPPRAQVEVTRADGSKGVLIAGVNGTDVIDKATTAANVAQSLLQDKSIKENLTVDYSPFKTITAQAYDKWIEVDTTNKRMYAYSQSTLARTFLITSGAPATPTVIGQYAIYAKYAQQDMKGENADGSNYFQPNVPWVNYFYQDYAIHGNYWRPLSYFGSINSSHGCVGIVDADAEWIYSWAPIGTPVIVHT